MFSMQASLLADLTSKYQESLDILLHISVAFSLAPLLLQNLFGENKRLSPLKFPNCHTTPTEELKAKVVISPLSRVLLL